MAALASLPLFFKLGREQNRRKVLLAGGSEGAAWKAELLQAAGALVYVFAPEPCEPMQQLAGAPASTIILHARPWNPDDFKGMALAIGDVEGEGEAEAFRCAGRLAGVPVNVVDKPAFCDFQFGSIVDRSPLVIGISTDGGAPVFGQALRGRIETLLPHGFRAWAQAARDWRPLVQAQALGFRARRAVWEAFTERALANPERRPDETDLSSLIEQVAAQSSRPAAAARKGRVILVGAGPGDPELLTLKAVRMLQSADVVLFDDLVSPRILDMARREAERIGVGKRGYKPSCTQEDIVALLLSLAAEGKTVVRLKGGDPMIFGRANEEIEALQKAGVEVSIVPGVTAASGAAAALKVSLTERDRARRVQFITAHGRDGALPADLDWSALCDPRATTIVYMGLKTLPHLSARLLAQGLDPLTPATLVERATWLDERSIRGTIASLPGLADATVLKGPCLVMIGWVLESEI